MVKLRPFLARFDRHFGRVIIGKRRVAAS